VTLQLPKPQTCAPVSHRCVLREWVHGRARDCAVCPPKKGRNNIEDVKADPHR
jgi:hypothetical protein